MVCSSLVSRYLSHMVALDHVLGADPTHRPGWQGYTQREMFHEPFVLFGYLAALTNIEAGLNPLPQRRSIPIWMGGKADVLLRRTARMGDSWFPQGRPDERMHETVVLLRSYNKRCWPRPHTPGIIVI